jgi:hypothetical protein
MLKLFWDWNNVPNKYKINPEYWAYLVTGWVAPKIGEKIIVGSENIWYSAIVIKHGKLTANTPHKFYLVGIDFNNKVEYKDNVSFYKFS